MSCSKSLTGITVVATLTGIFATGYGKAAWSTSSPRRASGFSWVDPNSAGFPMLFQFEIGSVLPFRSTVITIYGDGTIEKRRWPSDFPLTGKDVEGGKLAPLQWEAFLRKIDALKWWRWHGYYDNPHVLDGYTWDLQVKTGSLDLNVGGRNAGACLRPLREVAGSPHVEQTGPTGDQALSKALLELWNAAEPSGQPDSFSLFKKICGLPLNTTMLLL